MCECSAGDYSSIYYSCFCELGKLTPLPASECFSFFPHRSPLPPSYCAPYKFKTPCCLHPFYLNTWSFHFFVSTLSFSSVPEFLAFYNPVRLANGPKLLVCFASVLLLSLTSHSYNLLPDSTTDLIAALYNFNCVLLDTILAKCVSCFTCVYGLHIMSFIIFTLRQILLG